MRHLIFFQFILSSFLLQSQVNFTNIPKDKQLVPRDVNTNFGDVIIEGNVDNNSVNYQSIRVDVFKEGNFLNSISISLNYTDGLANFNFSIPINAELSNYSFKVYGEDSGSETLEKEIVDVVAGDAYIIQGQSNAVAGRMDFNDPSYNANIFQNDFIRVFAGGYNNPSVLQSNEEWNIANGNGYMNAGANTGQWGIKLAYNIVTSENIPVAIFNSAHPAQQIDFFQAPGDYQTSLASNYARLYYRLTQTGLKNHVRGLFWSQGEANANFSTTTEEYKTLFNQLKDAWLEDYPNIEHFYIFQTKNGCGKFVENVMKIKEAQRLLAVENFDISIIPTSGVTHHADLCHFPLVDGYETFADRLSPIVLRDFYGVSTNADIDAPMITNAYLQDATTIVIETDSASDLQIGTVAENFELVSDNQASITNISVNGSNIIITTSEDVSSSNPKVSYLGQDAGTPNPDLFVTNVNGLEIIGFSQFPVDTTTLSINNFDIAKNAVLYPNPAKNYIKITELKAPQSYKIYNSLGVEVKNGTVSDSEQIDVQELNSGLYFLVLNDSNTTLKLLKE